MADRVFLDANILFSAAFRPNAPMRVLWQLSGVRLLTCSYAVNEAERHLATAEQKAALRELLASVTVVEPPPIALASPGLEVHQKDLPIVLAAIHAQATHLLTGDQRHFGRYYGHRIAGVLVTKPSTYLARKR